MFYILGTNAAFKAGYHGGAYAVLEKLKGLNNELEKTDYDINQIRDEYIKFLIECKVENTKAPDFLDYILSYFKSKKL